MRILSLFLIINTVFSESIFSNFIKNLKPIRTEKEIVLDGYTGKWYQAATSRSTKLFGTGIDFKSVTATYNCVTCNCTTNNITVFNEGYNSTGDYVSINGYSYSSNDNQPCKRKVKFDTVPIEGNYWIVKLGPLIKGKYQYAVVSGPLSNHIGTRFSLYVICRDVDEFKEKYEKDVKDWCLKNGFSLPWNKYINTY